MKLHWARRPPPPAVDGTEPASAHLRPLRADGARYLAYTDALAALEPPALFDNRPCYRLLAAHLRPGRPGWTWPAAGTSRA